MTGLEGKVVLISGTAGGQGRAAALLFAGRGARVVSADIDASGAQETARLVREEGGEIVAAAGCDMSTPDGAQEWIELALDSFGAIDVLYNNASGAQFGTPADVTPESWALSNRNEIDIAWFPVQTAWPHLIERGGGVIINVASIAAIRGARFLAQVPHGTAKGAVLAMTFHLAAVGGPLGIRANAILPGLIVSPATESLGMFDHPDSAGSRLAAANPLGRAGRPEEVARLAAFLASDDGSYINGAAIPIDGGHHVVM